MTTANHLVRTMWFDPGSVYITGMLGFVRGILPCGWNIETSPPTMNFESSKGLGLLVVLCVLVGQLSSSPVTDAGTLVRVRQHGRVRRSDDGQDRALFPKTISFSIEFDNGRTEHVAMTKSINNFRNLQVTQESGIRELHHHMAAYQDVPNFTSIVVDCTQGDCTLQGSVPIDGRIMKIAPTSADTDVHTLRPKEAMDMRFTSDGVPASGVEQADLERKLEIHRRRKRAADVTVCNVVETISVVDYTVWNYWLAAANNVEATAELNLKKYYMSVYNEADTRYQSFVDTSPADCSECLNIYLVDIVIQKTQADSWSLQFGDGPITNNKGLARCADEMKELYAVQAIDHVQCLTRLDGQYGNPVQSYYRGTGYTNTICDPTYGKQYAASLVEAIGDHEDLTAAREIAKGIGARPDGMAGCVDNNKFLMSDEGTLAISPSSYYNSWLFSECSTRDICAYIKARSPNCLKDSSNVTQVDFDTFKANASPGTYLSLNEQCALRFGIGSTFCDNVEFPARMCEEGVICTIGGSCSTNKTRVYQGTPCGAAQICLLNECKLIENVALGAVCIQTSQCADANAVCDTAGTGQCTCKTGFFKQGSACVPNAGLSSGCTGAGQCADVNAECDTNANECVCNPGYTDTNGVCAENSGAVTDTCAAPCPGQCTAYGAFCDSGMCSCPVETRLISGGCWGDAVGDLCESLPTDTCGGDLVCDTGRCRCSDSFVQVAATCYIGTNGSPCTFGLAGSCTGDFAVCLEDNTCGCVINTFFINGRCEFQAFFGDFCEADPVDTCREKNTICVYEECVCKSGTARAGSECSGTAIGETDCSATSCSDPNTVCLQDVCSCAEGFFLDSGICYAGDYNDPCSSIPTDTCTESNTFCDSSSCACSTGYDRIQDACVGVANGATSCTDESCEDANAGCVGDVCTCNENFVDLEGVCVEGVYNDDCLPFPETCAEANTVCSEWTTTCICAPGFLRIGFAGSCLAGIFGDACLDNPVDTCTEADTVCMYDECVCRAGTSRDDGDTACVGKTLGETSCTSTSCTDADTSCIDGECSCAVGFTEVRGACSEGLYGDACSDTPTDTCTEQNTVCTAEVCACNTGYTRIGGACVGEALGATDCTVESCSDANAECAMNACTCSASYFDVNDLCVAGDYNDGCLIFPETCTESNTVCSAVNDLCTCASGTTRIDSVSACLVGIFGDACVDAPGDSCTEADTECLYDECVCRAGTSRDHSNTACVGKTLGETSCTSTSCTDANTACIDGECSCAVGFTEVSGACSEGLYGDACSDNPTDTCTEQNTVCTTEVCACNTGYTRNGGACVGEALGATDCTAESCSTTNAECAMNSCTCSTNFFDVNDVCVPGDYNDACLIFPETCTESNTVCSAVNSLCTCASGTTRIDSASACLVGAFGEACTDAPSDTCTEADTECLYEECVCRAGTSRDDGNTACVGKTLGETSCTSTSCTDANTACINGECACDVGFTEIAGACSAGLYNDACSDNPTDTCTEQNTVCAWTICLCVTGFTRIGDVCVGSANAATECTAESCTDPNAGCSSNACTCNSNFLDIGGTCVSGAFGEACTTYPVTCTESNTECGSGDTCECVSGTTRIAASTVCVVGIFGDACTSGTCTEANTVCGTGSTCECNTGYSQVGSACVLGCAHGWTEDTTTNYCYKLDQTARNRADAHSACSVQNDANLVDMKTESTYNFVKTFYTDNAGGATTAFWIGAESPCGSGLSTWSWSDGTKLEDGYNTPFQSALTRSCMFMEPIDGTFLWNKAPCGDSKWALCQYDRTAVMS